MLGPCRRPRRPALLLQPARKQSVSIRCLPENAVYRGSVIIGYIGGLLCPVWQLIGPAQTRLITTSILPRVALEYGHVWSASSTRAWATSRSTPGRLTLRRARSK